MTTKKIALTFYYLLCLFCLNSLSGQALQFENGIVESVEINVHAGTSESDDKASVLARLQTKQGGFFSQTDFDEDLKALAQDYDRIEPSVDFINNQVKITLDLWPKPTIRVIRWSGYRQVSVSDLQAELGIRSRSIFEKQAFNEAFHKLKAYYVSHGFFEAELDYHTLPLPDTNEIDIMIDINEGRSGKIQELVFINFTEDEKHAILKQMITKEYNRFTSWFTQEGVYNEEAMQQDRLIAINYLQNQGYADAHIDISVAEACKTNRIIVTIEADKGERYYFGRLSFEGSAIICGEDLDALFTIREGASFSLEDIRETIEKITDAYGRLGYIDAIIDFEPQLVEGAYRYDVHFKIEEGERFSVGLIRVFGNTCTQTSVILHETLLTPGEIFNNVKLKKTEQRLQNIGYFKNVNVYAAKGTESSLLPGNYRDVYIEVEETTTGQFSAFMGYSSVEEVFGGINITERNFNYKGLSRLWSDGPCKLRGGGEFVNLTAQIGQKSSNYIFSWTKPYFMDSKWTVGFDIASASTRYISKEYDLDTLGLNLRANYSVNQFVRAGIHYRLTNGVVRLHGSDKLSSLESLESEDYYKFSQEELASLKHEISDLEEGQEQLRKEADIHGLISAIGSSITYDSTDHPIRPRQGFRSKLYLELAGVWGDHSFMNMGYLNSYYFPVGSRNVIRYRADFRFIQPLGDTRYDTLPLDERIFLGGEYTVRGYRPYRLGPQYDHTHTPRGGISLQLYSIEFTRRLMKDIEIFAFFDAGQLSKETWEFGRLSAAVGYGTRFKVIESVPQITLGMGYPINPRNRSEVKKFFFSVGGNF